MTDNEWRAGRPRPAGSGQALTRQKSATPLRQDRRDARRSTPLTDYFCVGAWFCGAAGGADGVGVVCDFVCAGFTPENTDAGPVRRAAKIESVIDVSIKMIADQVVARERTEAAPRGPNAVWLP